MTQGWGQIIRFGIVGVTVAGLYVLLYLGLQAVMAQAAANALAFGLAVLVQYVGQTLFTFRQKLAVPDQIGRFAAMIGLGLLVSALLTGLIGPALGWADWAAAAAVTVILPVQNYLFMTLWVYAHPKPRNSNSDREATA